ncbi:MAG: hypothetical protein ABI150_06280 [Nitrobacter sp.]
MLEDGMVQDQTSKGTSTADLNFLHHLQRVRLQEIQIESGTGIIKFLVPFAFRSSLKGRAMSHELRKAGTSRFVARIVIDDRSRLPGRFFGRFATSAS